MSNHPPAISASALDAASARDVAATGPWRSPPLEYWHLLSLDAPSVAVVWTWFLAREFGVVLPWTVAGAMGLVVWVVYALDRLMDARRARIDQAGCPPEPLEARHLFHDRHRRNFTVALVLASAASLPLIACLSRNGLRLEGALGALLVLWFLAIHRWSPGRASRMPKEYAVGIFFACATLIPTLVRLAAPAPALLLGAALLGVLCTLNCFFIAAWEGGNAEVPAHLYTVTITLVVAATLAAMVEPRRWPVFCAIGLAALLLAMLSRMRHRLGSTSLRAAADLVLLTPLLVVALPR